MNKKMWLSLAGACAGLTSLGILAFAAPHDFWNGDGAVAAAIWFFSLASPALLPLPKPRVSLSDAPSIWLVGPLGKLWIWLLVLAGTAIRFSFIGWHTASWISCTLWLGSYLTGYFFLRASTMIVAEAARQTRPAGADPRARWVSMLSSLRAQAENGEVQQSLERLTETVRFAANELPQGDAEETSKIDELIGQLAPNLARPEELKQLVRSAEGLFVQREQSLKAARSRA